MSYEHLDGIPVDKLYLTITGTDAQCDQKTEPDETYVVVGTAKPGKVTYVPKETDGREHYQRQQVLVLQDYELIPSSDPRYADLVTIAQDAGDRRTSYEQQQAGFEGTEDLPAGEGANEVA